MKGAEVFQIPYNFDVNGAGSKENWPTVVEPEQMIFDLRTKDTKKIVKEHRETKSFK